MVAKQRPRIEVHFSLVTRETILLSEIRRGWVIESSMFLDR